MYCQCRQMSSKVTAYIFWFLKLWTLQEERKALFLPFSVRGFKIWMTKVNCSDIYVQVHLLSITGWFSVVNTTLRCNCCKIRVSNHNETGTDGSRSILIALVQGDFNQYSSWNRNHHFSVNCNKKLVSVYLITCMLTIEYTFLLTLQNGQQTIYKVSAVSCHLPNSSLIMPSTCSCLLSVRN